MTLMDEASRGHVTREIDSVAKCEQIEPERLARLVAAGRVVIPRNIRREKLKPMGIGELLTTKVNVNVGTSQSLDSIEAEVEKALAAVQAGANAVMDL
ncbi:MAG: phosphomethylpyrimidine synthase, partial [Methanothrix sp.]|nr:phosphomethylpyrimidine synthase [Methanothrix sp.]